MAAAAPLVLSLLFGKGGKAASRFWGISEKCLMGALLTCRRPEGWARRRGNSAVYFSEPIIGGKAGTMNVLKGFRPELLLFAAFFAIMPFSASS